MISTSLAVLAFILAAGILEAQAARKPKPKFCRGKDGVKYKPNSGYQEGCTKYMCVKKGKKIKMTSKPIAKCGSTTPLPSIGSTTPLPSIGSTTPLPSTAVTEFTTTTEADQCYGTIEEEGWYAGSHVVQEFKQDNAAQCGKSCCDNEDCKIWVWRSNDNMCHLKNDDNPSWYSAAGHWSAKRKEGNDCYEKNIAYLYNDINNGHETKVSTALECQKLCQSTDGCILFSWVRLDVPDGPFVGWDGECWVKHTKANKRTQKYIISGPKQCDTTTAATTPTTSTIINTIGPEENVNVTALQMNVDSLNATVENLQATLNATVENLQATLNATVENLQATLQALLSVVTKQGTCLSDFMSSDCPVPTPGKNSLVDHIISINNSISSNTISINSINNSIGSNTISINSINNSINSNAISINSNSAAYSSIQATTTNLETCLSDVNSVKCPSSKDGKTSVSDAIMKNKDDVQFHHPDSIYFIAGGYGGYPRDIELYNPMRANLSCSMSPPPLNIDWYHHSTFYYNNTIHLYGLQCISYNINMDEWKTHTLHRLGLGQSTIILNKTLYFIGGRTWDSSWYAPQSTPLPLTDQPVLTYVPMNYRGVQQCTTKVDEDTLVVTGGSYNGFFSSVIEYNAKNRTATSLPSMIQGRSEHGCAVVEMDNTKWIIVAGGTNPGVLETTEMLQMGGDSWKPLGNLNVARKGLSIALTQRGVMAMGGHSGSEYLSSVELLDWSTMSWRIVQPSLSKGRSNFGGAVEIPSSMFDCRG